MSREGSKGGKTGERQLPQAERAALRKARKAAPKAAKANRTEVGRKPCEHCSAPEREELIRCRSALWPGWRLVYCACWRAASGGVADGDADHPEYAYGGL